MGTRSTPDLEEGLPESCSLASQLLLDKVGFCFLITTHRGSKSLSLRELKAGHLGLDITSSRAGLYWKSLDGSGFILPTPGLRQGEVELAAWSWLDALGCVSKPRFHMRLIYLP